MAVSVLTNKVTYTCDGVQTVFPFTFPVLDHSDLKVYLVTIATGAITLLTEMTHYTVVPVGPDLRSGGNVVTLSTYSSTYEILLVRDVPLTQEMDYEEGDTFPAESHEKALDKLTMVGQQIQEQISRQLIAPIQDPALDMTLPAAATRALTLLGFDAAGKPIPAVGSYAPVSTFMATVLDDLTADDALTTLTIPTTAFMKTVLDDADADTARDTLYVGIEKWNGTKAYAADWLVTHQGNIYKSRQANTGQTPSQDSDYWVRYADGAGLSVASATVGQPILMKGSGYAVPGSPTAGDIISVGAMPTMCFHISVGTDKIAIVYTETDLKLVAATISSGTFTAGSAVTVTATPTADYLVKMVKIDTDKVLLLYQRSTSLYARVASISGTTVTLGTEQLINATAPTNLGGVCTLDSSRALILYPGGSGYPQAVVASISGTTISLGTPVQGEAISWNTVPGIDLIKYGTDKCYVLSSTGSSSNPGFAWVITVSGTVPTWQATPGRTGVSYSLNVFADISEIQGVDLGDGRSLFLTYGGGNVAGVERFIKMVMVRMDGDSPMGVDGSGYRTGERLLPGVWPAASGIMLGAYTRWCIFGNGIALVVASSSSAALRGKVEMLFIRINNEGAFEINEPIDAQVGSDSMAWASASPLADGDFCLIYVTSTYIRGIVLTVPQVCGIAKKTATGSVEIGMSGYFKGFTGLTRGCRYYLQPDGTLDTVGGLPESYVGLAISATEIIR